MNGPDRGGDGLAGPVEGIDSLRAGSVMSTVMVSPVVAGCVRTWGDDDGSLLWQVDDPVGLSALFGRGLTARSEVEPGRFREVGLLDSDSGTLLVPERFTVGGEVESTAFSVRPVTKEPERDRQWRDFAEWLGHAALSCAERGEFMVVEFGGWNHRTHPYALFAARSIGGQALSHLEVAPAPMAGHEPWPYPPENPEGATLSASGTRASVGVAGLALCPAINEWARSPFELAVTFGSSPDGPIQLADQ